MGYDVTILKDKLRILEVLANRNGETGGVIGLYFNGKVSHFEELPRPSDPNIQIVYEEELKERTNKIQNRDEKKEKSIFSFFMKLFHN